MNYKFKDIIEEIDEFNSELKYGLDDIIGVTIEKGLIPTVANLTQTNLDKFYLVKKDAFVYNPRTHGVRLGMGFNESDRVFVTSWNNVAFRVKDDNLVLPKYLWLFFNRPEWDRQSNYLAWGSSTIVFAWKDFLEIGINIPSLEEQQRIVNRYKAIENRIATNKQTITKLEEAAQALYRKMFVDDIDVENLPEGWRMGTLGEVAEILDYKRRPLSSEERTEMKGEYPYYGAMSVVDYIDSFLFDGIYLLFSEDGANVVDENGFPALQYVYGKFWLNNHAHILQGKNELSTEYLYLSLKKKNVADLVTGAAQPKINQENMCGIEVLVPDDVALKKFNEKVLPIFSMIRTKEQENNKLTELLSMVMAGKI